jgi:hypothetical protein
MNIASTGNSGLALLLAGLFSVGTANAGVYKCVIDGKTYFQDQPCKNEMVTKPDAAKPQVDVPTAGSEAFFVESNKPPYRPAQAADLATATPRDFFMRSVKACESKNEGDYFAQFSYRIRWVLSRKSPSQRAQMFELYCQETTAASVADMLSKRSFAIMQSSGIEAGVHKSILCWRPKETPKGPCQDLMDVAIENGQLKRDEF